MKEPSANEFAAGAEATDNPKRTAPPTNTERLTSLRAKPTAAGRTVSLPWSMDDPHELEKQVPRLKLMTVVSFLTMPEMVPALIHSRAQGMVARVMMGWGWYQRAIQHLRYAF